MGNEIVEDLILANAIADKQAYDVARLMGQEAHLSDQGRAIWSLIEEWYERDPDSLSVNLALLKELSLIHI